jgi:hypothetical protein
MDRMQLSSCELKLSGQRHTYDVLPCVVRLAEDFMKAIRYEYLLKDIEASSVN